MDMLHLCNEPKIVTDAVARFLARLVENFKPEDVVLGTSRAVQGERVRSLTQLTEKMLTVEGIPIWRVDDKTFLESYAIPKLRNKDQLRPIVRSFWPHLSHRQTSAFEAVALGFYLQVEPCSLIINFSSSMVGPLSYLGGKNRVAQKVVALIPEHNCYVEPFCGGAQVFFHKKQSNVEVLNDLDEEIFNFLRVCQLHHPELVRYLQFCTVSRKWFELFQAQAPKIFPIFKEQPASFISRRTATAA